MQTFMPLARHFWALLFPAAVATCLGSDAAAHTGPHAAHAEAATVTRSTVNVKLPSVRVRQHTDKLVAFDAAVDATRPVLLNFVFTSCTGICPPMSLVFAAAQERLGSRAGQWQMISVSLDPGHDTPARLNEYARRFGAGPQWAFYTGSQEAIDAVQRAFNIYRPDKMSHTAVTFVRPLGASQWIRLEGFASADRLIREAQGSAFASP